MAQAQAAPTMAQAQAAPTMAQAQAQAAPTMAQAQAAPTMAQAQAQVAPTMAQAQAQAAPINPNSYDELEEIKDCYAACGTVHSIVVTLKLARDGDGHAITKWNTLLTELRPCGVAAENFAEGNLINVLLRLQLSLFACLWGKVKVLIKRENGNKIMGQWACNKTFCELVDATVRGTTYVKKDCNGEWYLDAFNEKGDLIKYIRYDELQTLFQAFFNGVHEDILKDRVAV